MSIAKPTPIGPTDHGSYVSSWRPEDGGTLVVEMDGPADSGVRTAAGLAPLVGLVGGMVGKTRFGPAASFAGVAAGTAVGVALNAVSEQRRGTQTSTFTGIGRDQYTALELDDPSFQVPTQHRYLEGVVPSGVSLAAGLGTMYGVERAMASSSASRGAVIGASLLLGLGAQIGVGHVARSLDDQTKI